MCIIITSSSSSRFYMASDRNFIFPPSLIFFLALSSSLASSSNAGVWPTQSLLRMRAVLLRATRCHHCICFTNDRLCMIMNQPIQSLLSPPPPLVATPSLSASSSSSALFGASTLATASPENMDGANNINIECSTATMDHLRQGEEEQPRKSQQNQQQQQQQQHYRPLVIVLAGPTAVGKSDVASLLCSTTIAQDIMQAHFANYNYCHSSTSSSSTTTTTASLHRTRAVSGIPSVTSSSDSPTIIRGHVISADSVQVYRANIDVGSNKPSAEELLNTPYHLVGIVDPPNSNKHNIATKTSSTTTSTISATTSIPHTAKNLDVTTTTTTNTLSVEISSTSSPSCASVYGAADWMNDVMYVLRSLPTTNDPTKNHNPELVKQHEVEDHHHSSECNDKHNGYDTTTDDTEAMSQRREYIDRDLYHNLVASSSSGIDNGNNNVKNIRGSNYESTTKMVTEQSSHPSKSLTASSSSSSSSSPMIILPVVTGGTMMYLQWLVHGRPDAVRPTEEAIVRAADTIHGFRTKRRRETTPSGTMTEDGEDKSVVLHINGDLGHGGTVAEMDEDEDATGDEASCWEVASSYVSSLGPVFAKRVEKLPGRDWYRLRRLLEVAYTMSSTKTKKEKRKADYVDDKFSAVIEEGSFPTENEVLRHLTEKEIYTGIRSGSLADNGYDVRCFFLCPTDRMRHFHAVDERCEQMILRGLLRECADLYITGVLQTESQVSRAIGYRQTLEYLTRPGAKRNDGPALLAFVDDFATATRQYAKKQMQWFRREKDFAFIPVDMDTKKEARAQKTALVIAEMCKLHPIEYDSELSPENRYEGDNTSDERGGTERLLRQTPSLSTQTRLENERQGKGMKYFLSKRVHLVDGSDDLLRVLAEADACTRLVQGLQENSE